MACLERRDTRGQVGKRDETVALWGLVRSGRAAMVPGKGGGSRGRAPGLPPGVLVVAGAWGGWAGGVGPVVRVAAAAGVGWRKPGVKATTLPGDMDVAFGGRGMITGSGGRSVGGMLGGHHPLAEFCVATAQKLQVFVRHGLGKGRAEGAVSRGGRSQ